MSYLPPDAGDAATQVQIDVLRQLGPERRSELAAEWSDQMRATALQGIHARQPELTEREMVLEFARLALGEGLFADAFREELDG
jgi:hypothetical protein